MWLNYLVDLYRDPFRAPDEPLKCADRFQSTALIQSSPIRGYSFEASTSLVKRSARLGFEPVYFASFVWKNKPTDLQLEAVWILLFIYLLIIGVFYKMLPYVIILLWCMSIMYLCHVTATCMIYSGILWAIFFFFVYIFEIFL